MSLKFTSANTDYCLATVRGFSGDDDFAVSLWAYATAGMTNVDQTVWNLSVSGSTHYVRIYYYTGYQEDKPPYAITPAQYKAKVYDGTTTVTLLGGASSGWNHLVLRTEGLGGSVDNTYFYRNGSLVDSDATDVTPTNLTRMHVGCKISGLTKSEYFDGYVAELAHYEVNYGTAVLDASQVAGLARGVSPRLVMPYYLTNYWPLRSSAAWNDEDLVDLSGFSTNIADWDATVHPAVIDPCGPQIRCGAAKRREVCIDGLVTNIP